MTASSSVVLRPSDASTLPGWGPWIHPAGCREIDPCPMPDPLRLRKSPLRVRLPDISNLRDVVLVRLHDIPGIRSAQTIFVLDEARVHRVAPPP